MKFLPKGDWIDKAKCLEVNPEIFFPEVPSPHTSKVARDICRTCLVSRDCLNYALEVNPQYGIWGGTTVDDRIKIRRGFGVKDTGGPDMTRVKGMAHQHSIGATWEQIGEQYNIEPSDARRSVTTYLNRQSLSGKM